VRSSVFLPFRKLRLVIVDEEHETSYKQEDPAPRYNARDTAIVLATYYRGHTLLGTATPSLETFWNAKNGKYGYTQLLTRFGDMMLPQIEVTDVKELLRTKEMKPPFSPRLEEEIAKALDAHEQVILFQNRRGYAPVVECTQCGWTPTCDYCDVTLTYHQDMHRMVCHYCGKSFDVPSTCPNCGETHLKSFGFGTEKIEEEIKKRFPKARTARLDLDTTKNKNAHENIINNFAAGKTDILIGTQMVSKGLDFDNVHVVGILDADTMLTRPDFRSFERSFQMMSQVAGRAGRRNKRGYVILQTKHADYPVIRQVVDNDYASMYEEQMEERQTFRYPPFYRLIYIYLKHRDNNTVEQAAQQLGTLLRQVFGERILGPDKPAIARLQLLYIRKIALKVERTASTREVHKRLIETVAQLKQTSAYNALRVYFDVDPI
jgi:primosomal protein N' (replication factor Y)